VKGNCLRVCVGVWVGREWLDTCGKQVGIIVRGVIASL
jgi:hypothetical protein